MSRFLTAVGCSHPSIYLSGDVWKCSTCHNVVGRAANMFRDLIPNCPHPGRHEENGRWYCTDCGAQVAQFAYGPCDHPAIVFRDGGAYCTECGARVQ